LRTRLTLPIPAQKQWYQVGDEVPSVHAASSAKIPPRQCWPIELKKIMALLSDEIIVAFKIFHG
jgi:hypothetical protein